jgi:dTDP-4-dehydrorhamnose reductase
MIVGANGLLGQKVTEFLARGTTNRLVLAGRGATPRLQVSDSTYVELDITKKQQVREAVADHKPAVIINAAAMTNVDACEKERETAWKINVTGVENIIEAAKRLDATVVHVSTDYVFDGKSGPYSEDDRPEPINYYGRSKLASENQLKASGLQYFIARTMVLYGFAPDTKSNFALWLVRNLEERSPVRVVDDQMGNPTLVDDLAHAIISAVELEKTGVYHVAGREIVSRFEFALGLASVFGFDRELITPVKTSALNQPAQRPLKSGLITLKAEVELGYRPSTVEEGLTILKGQLSRTPRRLPDSAPIPGRKRS